MHSFNDIHDFDDAGRASYFNTVDATTSNRTTLLLPVELKCNPILSLSSTIEPSLICSSASVDEGTSQLSTFLPVTCVPLILADAGRQASGSSDFQSNAVLPYNSQGHASDDFTRKTSGLGLLLSPDGKASDTTCIPHSTSRSRTSSIDGLFPNFMDFSSDCLTVEDPFDDFGNARFVSGMLVQSDRLTNPKPMAGMSTAQTSGTFSSDFYSLGKFESSHAFAHQSPQQPSSAYNSFKKLPAFTGLVADINMFDKENANTLCVNPEDLVGQFTVQEVQDPGTPRKIKVECVLDESIELISSPPITPKYLKAPQPDWPQIPTEHLPFLVERYLAHFMSNTVPEVGNIGQGVMLPGPSAPPYTPITAEILEAAEEPRPMQDHAEYSNKFTDKLNIPRPRTGPRTGGNIMDMYEFLVPQDVGLDKPHEGVPIVTVVQKTKHFFMTHPGERLSEELLFSFAGRLNSSGLQIPGYRCYVQGCSKTTKRKDHMADHVRTHLGEKPFQCSVCGMGFIRNNDCQRHENNHRPDKKFVCACKAAFSRRDLFVRHQKTVCTMSQGTMSSGCIRRPRKYSKVTSIERRGTPDGDDANDLDYVPGDASWATMCA